MKYTSVGINAPTLDNSDECTFIRNEDLLYATAGDANNGATANLVLYEKLIDPGCHRLLDSPDISRNTFKSGSWGLPVNGADQPWNGGDYYIGAFAQIKADLFRAGKLNQLRFKFFTKDSYETENPNLIIPDTNAHLDTQPTEEELWERLNDKTINNGIVTKVAFLTPNIVDDIQDGWRLGSFAKLNLDNLPLSDNDWFLYDLEEELHITAQMMAKQNYTFAIFFFPNSDNWRSSDNKTVEEKFKKTAVFSPQALRNIVGDGNSDRVVVLRSVPRGSIDGSSYVYAPTVDTSNGTKNGQNRLLEVEYCIDTDLVNEYLGDNAEKHHLDIKEVQEMNTLRYDAPLTPDNSWEEKKTPVEKVFISDESLSRGGAINILGKQITSIRIPFKLGSNENYLVSGMIANQMINRAGGLCHTNRKLRISLDNEQTYIESTNYFAYSYFDEHMIYEWFFESDNQQDLAYKGNGITIRAIPPLKPDGTRESGNNTFALNIFKKGEKYYAYSLNDRIDSTSGSYRNINATPEVKVVFNYIQRGEWFDYIENKENNTIVNVENINNYIDERSEVFDSLYVTQNTYTQYISDRIKFKWVEFCPTHSLSLKGALKRIDVVMSSNQWDVYTKPVYLCVYEKNDEDVFVKKAVSIEPLIPQRATTHSWYFNNIKFTGKPVRVGYISSPDDTLANLGETQTNPSMQTNAITNDSGYDGECYVCNDSGSKQKYGCPMSFFFNNVTNIEDSIDILKQSVTNIQENVTNVTQVVNNIIQEGALNLGKWRIYVNEEGNLIIDTEALAAAGKSITFKDIEI